MRSSLATAAAAATLVLAAPSYADTVQTFAAKCAGCHAGGGNVVQAGATLKTPDLERNGYDTAEALYSIIYSGKGKMPGFGQDCAPRCVRPSSPPTNPWGASSNHALPS